MASISSSWVGIARGRMGEGVYYLRKGRIFSRQYVEHIHQPRTEKHERDWENWRECQKICNTLKWAVKEFWKNIKEKQTEINALMSYTRRYAYDKVGMDKVLNWERVRFASGSLFGVKGPLDLGVVGQSLVFGWEDNSGKYQGKADDLFVYMMINVSNASESDIGKAYYRKTTQKRSDGSFSLDISDKEKGDYRVYGCFISADEKEVSDSVYFGLVNIEQVAVDSKQLAKGSKAVKKVTVRYGQLAEGKDKVDLETGEIINERKTNSTGPS